MSPSLSFRPYAALLLAVALAFFAAQTSAAPSTTSEANKDSAPDVSARAGRLSLAPGEAPDIIKSRDLNLCLMTDGTGNSGSKETKLWSATCSKAAKFNNKFTQVSRPDTGAGGGVWMRSSGRKCWKVYQPSTGITPRVVMADCDDNERLQEWQVYGDDKGNIHYAASGYNYLFGKDYCLSVTNMEFESPDSLTSKVGEVVYEAVLDDCDWDHLSFVWR